MHAGAKLLLACGIWRIVRQKGPIWKIRVEALWSAARPDTRNGTSAIWRCEWQPVRLPVLWLHQKCMQSIPATIKSCSPNTWPGLWYATESNSQLRHLTLTVPVPKLADYAVRFTNPEVP